MREDLQRELHPPTGDGYTWEDYTRTPYEVFVEPAIFDDEQTRLFRGPTWNYVGLECEVMKPGDFITSYVGTTPVVLSRSETGELHCFVNRCTHRGAAVVRTLRGNAKAHTCIYHQWCYGTSGNLIGVPLAKGLQGKGGYPEDFRLQDFGLERLRVETHAGVVFATFSRTVESLAEYIGEDIAARISLICGRPLRVTGYQRHTIKCNWKLFCENARDPYHAPLLHPFLNVFGILQASDKSTCASANGGKHAILTAWASRTPELMARNAGRFRLEDPEVVGGFSERDGMTLSIVNIFPSTLFTIVDNALSIRQIRPKSPDTVELLYTWFAYQDDDAAQVEIRRKQGNLFGPAGYVAMEDAEALELIQNSIPRGDGKGASILLQGGPGMDNLDHMVTEMPVRTFWQSYREMMGMAGASISQA